jgi:hypothetical protein
MSFPGSDYERKKEDRTKARIATWKPINDESIKTLEEDKPITNNATTSKYVSKYGSAGKQNTFIISQSKKKKKLGELDSDEDLEIISAFGSGGSGASKVDSREYVLDEGGWTAR